MYDPFYPHESVRPTANAVIKAAKTLLKQAPTIEDDRVAAHIEAVATEVLELAPNVRALPKLRAMRARLDACKRLSAAATVTAAAGRS